MRQGDESSSFLKISTQIGCAGPRACIGLKKFPQNSSEGHRGDQKNKKSFLVFVSVAGRWHPGIVFLFRGPPVANRLVNHKTCAGELSGRVICLF